MLLEMTYYRIFPLDKISLDTGRIEHDMNHILYPCGERSISDPDQSEMTRLFEEWI